MAGITQAQAEAKLTLYLAALDAVLANQEYSINGRTFKRANLADIEKGISFWDAKVKQLDRGGLPIRGVTPVI
jgi:hypothetical protein